MGAATEVYSCDDHLDLPAVPPHVWESRLPKSQVERGPRVVERDGETVWVAEDRVLNISGKSKKNPPPPGLGAIGRAGLEDDGYRPGNAKLRLADLALDNVAASVIYGPLALGLPIEDPVLQDACYAAWNDWAVEEFNAVDPDKLCVLAFLPGHSPDAAAAELERCAGIGHRGAIIDVFEIDLQDRAWDRLWAAAQETKLPVSFHIKGGTPHLKSYQMGKWQSAALATVMPLQLAESLVMMLFGGALERHPGFKLVLAESGVGWLPYFLTRSDLEWRALKDKVDYAPKIPPSELFRRQVMATFEEEELGAQLIPLLGAENCMWASDYPHTDSTFPNSRKAIEDTLGTLSDADIRKVTATNCAELYGFPTPA